MDIAKTPPQALDLEEAVLGALMVDSSAIDQIASILKSEMFYTTAHSAVYETICTLYATGSHIDILTVSDALKRAGKLKDVGGNLGLMKLTDRVSSAANIETHARIIIEKFIKRELIRSSIEAVNACYDDTEDVFDLLGSTYLVRDQLLDAVTLKKESSLEEITREILLDIAENNNKSHGITGIPSGFVDLDKITGGWQKTDLIIIAARPAMGKTTLAMQVAYNAAYRFEKPVAVFSLEMSKTQVGIKILSMASSVEHEKIRKMSLPEIDVNRLHSSASDLAKANMKIDDTAALSIFEFRAKARRLKALYDIQLIVVDYLQLMTIGSAGKGVTRDREVSMITSTLKNLAKELEIPVIALSQLNRSVDNRAGNGKRPMLSDLRESGSIEQDADLVLFLYRPEYYGILEDETGASTAGLAEVIISKNRHGETDDVMLNFSGKYSTFFDVDPSERNIPLSVTRPSRMNDIDGFEDEGIKVLQPNRNFYEKDRDDLAPF